MALHFVSHVSFIIALHVVWEGLKMGSCWVCAGTCSEIVPPGILFTVGIAVQPEAM